MKKGVTLQQILNNRNYCMGKRIKKLKKIRIHHEGNPTLIYSLILLILGATLVSR